MTDKPTVTVGDLVCVGFAAGRNPELDSSLSEHIYMIYEQSAIGCVIKIER